MQYKVFTAISLVVPHILGIESVSTWVCIPGIKCFGMRFACKMLKIRLIKQRTQTSAIRVYYLVASCSQVFLKIPHCTPAQAKKKMLQLYDDA